ncbi:MAG: hypothetical protein BAJATHORv1_20483 [Candidatus Thorarchaeota archaeon]|nr:MAG: hypothetical protein BAJATHORv1_20483 [Candidatus Thorarchaeota archaeon]
MGDDREFIMGFDILPSHSVRSRKPAKYACVVMLDGIVLNEYSNISRGALIRLVREIEPKWLCTDNIFEIVPDSNSLFSFVDRLPHDTRIVQVTGVPPKQVPLKRLARKYKLKVRGKPTPLESAKIAAELASLGVGYTVECFSGQTEIKVVRGRKLGRGGQSANRYRRKMHSRIQQMTRHIESILKRAEIEYDITIRESDFGYARSRIVAYAPFPAIKDLIESSNGRDFRVIISPVRKRTEFLPLEPEPSPILSRAKYFILGIDPGITAAICLLTLNGTIHKMTSKKNLTRADIIRMVYQEGIPVLVASDVQKTPSLVKKIASTINADIYTPPKDIPVSEKQEIAREYAQDTRVRNAHERDALTAAVFAYRSILSKLQQIDRKVREEQIAVDRSHLKALVIKGTSIDEAITQLTTKEVEPEEEPSETEIEEEPLELTPERFEALKDKCASLESETEILEEKLEDSKRLVEFLRFRESELSRSLEIVQRDNYWKVKRDRELAKKEDQLRKSKKDAKNLRRRLDRLKKRLSQLRGVKRLEMRGDMIAVKSIPHFTRESIEEFTRKVSPLKAGDIILFEDASGGGPQTARILIEKNIRAVIVDNPISHLSREELVRAIIPVIDADCVELQRVDEFAYIDRSKFEQQMKAFVDETKERARQKGEEALIELVERYRRDGSASR